MKTPLAPAKQAALRLALEHAVQAPSGHNTQPWLFKINSDGIELLADRRRALPVVDPEDRALVISCGAALFNLLLGIRHSGYTHAVETLAARDTDLLARVSVKSAVPASESDERLFDAIPRRHTNRIPFEDRRVPEELLAAMQHAATSEGAHITYVLGEAKRAVADLIAEGDRLQAADPNFRRELAAWVHPNVSGARDGIPGGALGVPLLASFVFPLILRTFNWGDGQAAKDHQLATGSPVLALLWTDDDTPASWLSAGQALQRALLTATSKGLCASFLNQPIEVASLRPELARLTEITGHPQLLLRFGYGAAAEPTPRREVGDVLIQSATLAARF
jgi:hypothetical protein